MLLSVLSCEDKNEDEKAECNVNILAETCSNTNCVWLNCKNGTGDGFLLHKILIQDKIEFINSIKIQ